MRRNNNQAMSVTRAMYFLSVMVCTSLFLYLGISIEAFSQRHLVRTIFINGSSNQLFRRFHPRLTVTDGIHDSVLLPSTTVSPSLHKNVSTGVSTRSPMTKHTNVVFLKVHKAGSTTMMNIFLRFGVANKLNIVLPSKENGFGFNYLGYGKTVDKNTIVPIPENETYNILCNHVVYNRQAFREIMPSNTVYVGIVREPVSHFLSASVYYRFIPLIQKASGLSNQSSPTEVIHEYFTHQDRYSKIRTFFVRNRMSYDFGLPQSRFDDNYFVEQFISDLAIDFKLVMVMEYFPESLVLLKRYLGWDLEDILYVPLNINTNKSKQSQTLFPADISKLKQWNNADFHLYEFFKRRFLAQVEAEGPLFHKEVQHFKKVQVFAKTFCSNIRPGNRLTVHASEWNDEFLLGADHCKIMTMSEIPLLKILIHHAKLKYKGRREKKQIS